MSDLSYLAEGMAFEERCNNAVKLLTTHFEALATSTGGSIGDVLSIARRYTEFRDDPGNPPSPALLELLEKQEQEDKKRALDASTKLFEVAWKGALGTLSLFWGRDAVEYAAKIVLAE